MRLSQKASEWFRGLSREKLGYTADDLAKAEALLKEEGFVASTSNNPQKHAFVKNDESASASICLKGSGIFDGRIVIDQKHGENMFQTTMTIRDYVKRKEIEAEKNPVKKLLKMIN